MCAWYEDEQQTTAFCYRLSLTIKKNERDWFNKFSILHVIKYEHNFYLLKQQKKNDEEKRTNDSVNRRVLSLRFAIK